MTERVNDCRIRSLLRLADISAVAVICAGLLVLIGWILDYGFLKSVFTNLATMKPNTALSFILAGLSLWMSQRPTSRFVCGVGRLNIFVR